MTGKEFGGPTHDTFDHFWKTKKYNDVGGCFWLHWAKLQRRKMSSEI